MGSSRKRPERSLVSYSRFPLRPPKKTKRLLLFHERSSLADLYRPLSAPEIRSTNSAGWDKAHGFQLYMSDPSGNYGGWKAAAVGANSQAAQSVLKQDYRDGMNREEAVALALKVLSKTMDSTSLTAQKLELAEVFLQPGTGEVHYQVCPPEAMGKLLSKAGLTQTATEA